jgi:hypothetical protein
VNEGFRKNGPIFQFSSLVSLLGSETGNLPKREARLRESETQRFFWPAPVIFAGGASKRAASTVLASIDRPVTHHPLVEVPLDGA